MYPQLEKLFRPSRRVFLNLLGLGLILYGLDYLHKLFFPLGFFSEKKSKKILEDVVKTITPTKVKVQLDNCAIVENVLYKGDNWISRKVLIAKAVRLLNTMAEELYRKDFPNLSDVQKKEVLNRAMKSPTPGRYLLVSLREEVINIYYGNASVWRYLGLETPPQPFGFMEYDKRP